MASAVGLQINRIGSKKSRESIPRRESRNVMMKVSKKSLRQSTRVSFRRGIQFTLNGGGKGLLKSLSPSECCSSVLTEWIAILPEWSK